MKDWVTYEELGMTGKTGRASELDCARWHDNGQ